MVFKQLKRSFSNEEPACQIAHKHSRLMDHGGHYSSFADIFPCFDFGGKVHFLGKEEVNKLDCEGALVGNAFKELTRSTSWVSNNTNDKRRLESALCLPCSGANIDHDCSGLTIKADDLYSSFFEFPPRKAVMIGPDHQADIPVWIPSTCLAGFTTEDEEKMMGTCVISFSLSSSDMSSSNFDEVGKGKVDCSCPDEGSIRCVRQHVMEAKEKIRADVGQDKFLLLGFDDMGEVVSSKWSEEEEQLFLEVVYSNPASMGRNFWDHLLHVFPHKTTQDLVSYYFNVFMLWKRADQNRLDPRHVDSDNDEWQGGEDGDECGSIGDEEDSADESPADQAAFYYSDLARYEDEVGIEGDSFEDIEEGNLDGDNNEEMVHFGKSFCCGGPTRSPNFQLAFTNEDVHVSENQDGQDGSDTYFESQLNAIRSLDHTAMETQREHCKDNKKLMHDGSSDSRLGDTFSNGFSMEPCESKVWDAGYLSGPTKEVDFLPTLHVIEEVFGESSK